MDPILFTHLMAVGIWIGCVMTETVMELAEQYKPPQETNIAAFHWKIDMFVELPAIAVALGSGLMLASVAAADPLIHTKIGLGLTAAIGNLISVVLIYKRNQAHINEDWATYKKLDLLHARIGKLFLVVLVATFGLGAYLLVG